MKEAPREAQTEWLQIDLLHIEEADIDYVKRYGLVLDAMTRAHRLGFVTGYRFDPNEPEWPVAYIELPTGQVSWHMPQFPMPYDGHSTEEKYRRIHEWIEHDDDLDER